MRMTAHEVCGGSIAEGRSMGKHSQCAGIVVMIATVVLAGCGGGSEVKEWMPQLRQEGAATATTTSATRTTAETRTPTGRELAEYLDFYAREYDADCGPHACKVAGIARWKTLPVVRVHRDATPLETAQVRYAVALINRALPYDTHVQVGTGEVDEARTHGPRDAQPGEILLQFVDSRRNGLCPEAGGCGGPGAYGGSVWNESRERWEKTTGTNKGFVLVNRDKYAGHPLWDVVNVLVHELMHAAGLSGGSEAVAGASEPGHPPDGWPDTVMSYHGDEDHFAEHGFLPALDEATLIALYGPDAVESTAPEDLFHELRDWASKPVPSGIVSGETTPVTGAMSVNGASLRKGDWHIGEWGGEAGRSVRFTYLGNGRFEGCYVTAPGDCKWSARIDRSILTARRYYRTVGEPVRFGVRENNNVLVPWTEGPASSGGVSGRASWTGILVGLTPEHASVKGTARLALDFSHSALMEGRAAFTDIHHERDRRPWRADDDGYDDGALTYTLHGTGNTFFTAQPAGADAGDVNGRFYGDEYEGAAGSLERRDLTGAFGATRDGRYEPVESEEYSVEAVRSDGEGGFDAALVVGGVQRQISFDASDLQRGGYNVIEDLSYWLWEAHNYLTDRFPDAKDGFGHFDAYGWEAWEGADEEELLHRGYVVIGNPTAALPAGTATYAGPSRWFSYAVGVPHTPSNRWLYLLDVELAVDFDTASVEGGFRNMQYRRATESGWRDSTWEVALRNGRVTDTGIRADLVDTIGDPFSGSLKGQFFGPDAVEAGGLISGEFAETDEFPVHVVEGWFGAAKEDPPE